MTKTQTMPIHPALQDFIGSIKIFSADFTAENGLSNEYRFVPTYQRYLMFYIEDPLNLLRTRDPNYVSRPASIIVGPMEKPVMLNMGKKHLALGVAFKPGGLFRLLNMPLSDMFEQDIDTRLLVGNEIDDLNCQLRETSDWNEMFRIVERFLLSKLSRLRPTLPIDMALHELVRSGGSMPIDKVAAMACMSTRQFERKCLEREGMSPKRYARLIRFCKAYRLKELDPLAPWTKIAHLGGYYDQMHFIRDFREFADIVPSFLDNEKLSTTIRLYSHMD